MAGSEELAAGSSGNFAVGQIVVGNFADERVVVENFAD